MSTISEMENAVGEDLSLVFDDMDPTHVVPHHLPAVVALRDVASVRDLNSWTVQSLNLSRKNL